MELNKKSFDGKLCKICSHEEYSILSQNKKWGKFSYIQCLHCRALRLSPYPTPKEIEKYYAKYLQRKKAEGKGYLSEENYYRYKSIKELTFKDLGFVVSDAERKLLDVGCATGDFVKLMSDLGFDAEGIDISEELVDIAAKRKLKCSVNTIENINRKFDCISLWHVIEHVSAPRELLLKACSLLKKDGDLFIETPCYGLIAEAFGSKWRFYIPPEHICIFTQHGLLRLLCDTGFVIKNWVLFGSGNDTGKMPAANKNAMDCIAKKLQIGDTIAVWAKKA